MIYTVIVVKPSEEDEFAASLGGGSASARSVYVVGVDEIDALASALIGNEVNEISDPDAANLLNFRYVRFVGHEVVSTGFVSPQHHFDEIIKAAKQEAKELQLKHPSPLARMAA